MPIGGKLSLKNLIIWDHHINKVVITLVFMRDNTRLIISEWRFQFLTSSNILLVDIGLNSIKEVVLMTTKHGKVVLRAAV